MIFVFRRNKFLLHEEEVEEDWEEEYEEPVRDRNRGYDR